MTSGAVAVARVGELVGGNMGLGYLLSFGEGQANTAMVFVSIVMLTLVGGVAYLLVILIEQRVLHYCPSARKWGSSQPYVLPPSMRIFLGIEIRYASCRPNIAKMCSQSRLAAGLSKISRSGSA